jgi:flagellar hook-basal body complex protein FliE
MAGPLNIDLDSLKSHIDKLSTEVTQIEKKGAVPFQDVLKGFISEVNDLQLNVDKKIEQFASGETKDLHEVMIAVEEADIAFQLMMEIRNKLVSAFEEVMKMSV